MHSYWEQEEWLNNIDFAIIGGGIVGITCSLQLREKFPKAKIVILERGYLPSGASSKNAGFACFGSPSEILSDLGKMTDSEVFELVEKRIKGLEKLKEICGVENIDFQQNGGYEIFTKSQTELFENVSENLDNLNKLLYPIFGEKCYSHVNHKISDFGFDKIDHLILNKFEGQIDTGKMMSKLLDISRQKNIITLNGIEITSFEDYEEFVGLTTSQGSHLKAKKLFIANNGFANKILQNIDLKPARAQVLITKPIDNLPIKGTFHMDEGFYYFRNINNRILFGGGRNLDFAGETTSELNTTDLIQDQLKHLLKEMILPNTNFEVDYSWSGIMGVGEVKKPILEQHSANVYCGIRLGGMGVAIGSLVGTSLANLILND